MKANKITVLICATMVILFVLGTVLADAYSFHTVSSISANIFTGALVSGIIALAGYFNKKEKLFYRVETNLRQIYVNLITIKIKTGELIPKISGTDKLDELPFKQLSGLCDLHQEFAKGMQAELYQGFWNDCTACFMCDLKGFKTSLSNLSQVTIQLHASVLEHDISYLHVATQFPSESSMNINNIALKEQVLIKVSHLHEYQASLLLECEKLLEQFYKVSKPKKKWHEEKQTLESSAAFILNQSR